MRQRIKVAAALVHDPRVLLLDEPLNGTDPVQRASLIALMRRLGDEGKSVIVSSHVLSEVERFARNVLVIVNGKLAAAGDYRAIRDKMDERDHIVRIRCSDPRRLAAALVAEPVTTSVRFVEGERVIAETDDVRRFSLRVPEIARQEEIHLFEIQPVDESLASVFSYLVSNER
jgi:ABC-2 type transport system ATP-binding protein